MNKKCVHEKGVQFDNILKELSRFFSQEIAQKQFFTAPEIQKAKENWVCIDVV